MGADHFALPVQFGPAQGMKDAPDSRRWDFLPLHKFFSLLLLLTEAMIVALAVTRRAAAGPGV